MKILVHFRFTAEQMQALQEMARSYGDHEVVQATSDEEAVGLAPEIEVLMGRLAPEVCAAAPNLRWAQSFSAGMDKVLFQEIIERDVVVSNVAGLYAPQGGEHAWALLLALARGLPYSMEMQRQKRWERFNVVAISGGTLGLIGLGGFGLEMTKRAQGYEMTIIAVDPVRKEKPEGISELKPNTKENTFDLLRRSDVVMLACPLTKETYHLIGREELAAMKNSAYLINVTRGGIIDEEALAEALETGQIAGAGLDVCEEEPLPQDSPLWNAPNLIITPHRAGFSQHRPREVFEFAHKNLERYLKGEPVLNVVNKRLGF